MQLKLVLLACLGGLLTWGCRGKDGGERSVAVQAGPPPLTATGTAVVLAELAERPDEGVPPPAAALAFSFADSADGVAWIAAAGESYRVVHNGRPGPVYRLVGDVVLSPDGKRYAYAAMVGIDWRMVIDGVEGPSYAELLPPVFSADGAHVAYAARTGTSWRLVVDGKPGSEARNRFVMVAFAGHPTRIVYMDDPDDQERGRLVVTDLGSKSRTVIGDRFAAVRVSKDGSWVAAVALEGKQQRVLKLSLDGASVPVVRGAKYDVVERLAFGPRGVLGLVGTRGGVRIAALDGEEIPLPRGDPSEAGHLNPIVVRPGGKGLGLLAQAGESSVSLREFPATREGPWPTYEEAESLVYSPDGRHHAYAARRGDRWHLVVDGTEGPPFERVVSPIFTPDGERVVYRARQDGQRFVVVADKGAKTLRALRRYEMVYPVRLAADGKAIVFGVKDGLRLATIIEPL